MLANYSKEKTMAQSHAAILLAGQPVGRDCITSKFLNFHEGASMRKKSVVSEAREIQAAIEMISLGARLQLLESETNLSRERLIKLYKELKAFHPQRECCLFPPTGF